MKNAGLDLNIITENSNNINIILTFSYFQGKIIEHKD
jgi:hypothetical protein